MKAFALFLLRLATGLYLVAWAGVKLVDTGRAIDISDKFYLGYFGTPDIQHGLGVAAAVLGIFAALGFWRVIAYPVQALVLGVAAAAVAKAVIVTPVDLANGIEAATLLLPTLAVFLLSLSQLVWWKDDFLTLDRFIDWRLADLSREASYGAALAAPVAVAAVVEEMTAEPEVAVAEPVEAEAEPAEVEAVAAEPVEDVEVAEAEAAEVEAAEPVLEEEPVEIEAQAEEAGEAGHVEAEAAPEEEAAIEAAPMEAAHEAQAGEVEEEEIRIDPALVAHAEHVEERAAHPVH
jgi:hypothetical protein